DSKQPLLIAHNFDAVALEWRGMIIVDNEIPRECQIAYFLCTFGTVMDVISRIGLARALYMPDKPNLIYD
ncbi:hypothetical protein, partial [Paramuribaculum intestinale]|uniref:hypothetical protein n=1 Tax=Paramuribaculum intestinale TaxID=2094151 RepID=UPI0025B696B1